ncbi:MAG: hypothetical protein ACSLFQ_02085 [Thermoanaerobaculia bacterium]
MARILPKFRTGGREPAPGEFTGDYVRLTVAEFDRHAASPDFYWYPFGADRFGVHRADLESFLATTRSVVVVIRSTAIIRRLQQDLTDVDVIPVFLSTPLHVIRERLEDNEVTRRRLARAAEFDHDFDRSLYRAVLCNDGSPGAFEQSLCELLNNAAIAA